MKRDRVYTVRLVRPVLQSATLVVEAPNADSALQKALRQSATLTETDWSAQASSNSAYGVHAEAVVDIRDVGEGVDDPDHKPREFRDREDENEAVRYLLLSVDTQSRKCNIVAQPWFLAMNAQTQAELSSAWMQLLNFVIENEGIDAKGWRAKGREVDDDNVIVFPSANDGTGK
ncbi:MAG: hypothetical protein MPJ78_04485 [Hyphomicrobiaceae bacterium]|nr:hypothetical protein [Hyphomicrobiaceae bacterium]